MAVAFLKERSLGRIIAGHPWIYTSDISRIEKPPSDGDEITVRNARGGYVGNGFYHSKSRIPVRIFSRSKEKLEGSFFRKRILEAKKFREAQSFLFTSQQLPSVYRLIWSEADFLPGLIIDRYGDALVLQTLTFAMDQRKGLITDILKEIFQPTVIIERNDFASRQFEGLPVQKGILWGEGGSKRMVYMGKARFEMDLLQGQKTGSYLDQISNQTIVGALAKGKRVLDCFTYHGGFAIHAALNGAAKVEAWDISEEAVTACRHNAILNGVPNIEWKVTNVFDELNIRLKAGEKFDLIILDPPSFTKSREKLPDALRGYKEIHLKALKLLGAGGLLATFCCSHHVDSEIFRSVVLDAAFDTHKLLRLRQTFSQSWDHPIIPAIPETEYLKGFLFEVV